MDFTIRIYAQLLSAFQDAGYAFQSFSDFIEKPKERSIVLRHDVDARKLNSLLFAKIQAERGIQGTYYFRMVPQSFDENIIRDIADLNHEIGYHYETMDSAGGNVDEAYNQFCKNLDKFREIITVKTICMHGSPLSKYDNKDLWKKYNYKELGIIGEPYFDIDFTKVGYFTDTGRRWDGEKVSVRDKVNIEQGTWNKEHGSMSQIPEPKTSYRHTNDIIEAAKTGKLPVQLMLTFHPQRWTDKPLPWVKELVWQNIKNMAKRVIVKS